jgi:diguanylate cyclase (GGDEF)-like protein
VLSRSLSQYLTRTGAEARLRHASQHDALTGLPNRVYIGEQLDAMLRQKMQLALLYIDLDRYKIINDTLGHSTGDKALIEVARRISSALPDGDIAGRLGGDEFVAVLSQPASRDAVEQSARAVLKAIEKPLMLANRALEPHDQSVTVVVPGQVRGTQ